MLETEELIQTILRQTSEPLEFTSCTIYAVPSFNTSLLISSEMSVYRVEQQEYNFMTSTKDCFDNDITVDMNFTMSDNIYEYTFKTNGKPISQLDGWSRLPAILLSKAAL